MAFGIATSGPDLSDAFLRVRAGLPVLPGDEDAATPALPQPQPMGGASPQPVTLSKPSAWDVLQGVLFNGQSPADAAMAARQRNYQLQTMQRVASLLPTLPKPLQAAAMMGGPKVWEEIAKNYGPQTRSAGQQTDYMGGMGQGGYTASTGTAGIDDKSGFPTLTSPDGSFRRLGPSLGGGFSAKDGVIASERTGGVAGTYSLPQIVAPGARGVPFTPSVGGQGAGAAGLGAPSAQPVAGPATGPRGIRNNNFGNVKTPPGGPWLGQVGVDDQGHAIFDTPENGVRAARANLEAYAKNDGINTVGGLVSRWAGPQASPQALANYATYLSGTIHVAPDQKIDLTDPKVQQPLLKGIFAFENGPAAMAAWRGAGAPKSATQAAGGGARGPGFGAPFAQGREPAPMTADQRKQWGIPASDTRAWMMGVDGKPAVVAEAQYGPKDVREQRTAFFNSPEYQEYTNAANAANNLETLLHSFTKNNSVLDQAALDNGIRTMTGLSARNQNVVNFTEHLGLPDKLVGAIFQKFGNGYLTPDVVMGIRTMIHGYAEGHRPAAEQRMANETQFAKQNGQEFSAMLPQLIEQRPVPYLDGRGQRQDGPAPISVKTPQEARALPPGTPILLPDGRTGVVPRAKR